MAVDCENAQKQQDNKEDTKRKKAPMHRTDNRLVTRDHRSHLIRTTETDGARRESG